MSKKRLAESIIPIVIALFFIQALRVIFSVMFGFIYDQVFEGPADAWLVVGILFVVVAMLLPAWVQRVPSWRWMASAAIVASAWRVALCIDDPWFRYLGSLLIIATAGVLFVPLIQLDLRKFLRSMVIALVLEQLLRALGHTMDVSLAWRWTPILAIWIAVLLIMVIWAKPWSGSERAPLGGITWGTGAAIGAFLFLETSLLGLPNAIARWGGVSYVLVAPLLLILTILPLYPGIISLIRRMLSPIFIRVMFVIILIGGLVLGYFMSGMLALSFLLFSQWVLLCVFLLLGEVQATNKESVGGRLALGFLLFLLLNFMNAFAFTYPYTLPFMRGSGWLIFVLAGVLVGWGSLAVFELLEAEPSPEGDFQLALGTIFALGIVLVSIWPRPGKLMPSGSRRFATYNIHYGYDDDWHTTLPDIASALAEARVDVVAMQEVDTGRITSYSTDNAYYLARILGMNVRYLPTVEHLTGIAVLYKGEALDQREQLLASFQEQTGIIEVVLPWGEERVHSYGIWMGLSDEDTMRQVDAALRFITDKGPATFGGDFNARIEEPEMRAVQAAGFADPFTALGQVPAPLTSPAIDPQSRIDFVWLRGLKAEQAWVSASLASDHRLVVVEIAHP